MTKNPVSVTPSCNTKKKIENVYNRRRKILLNDSHSLFSDYSYFSLFKFLMRFYQFWTSTKFNLSESA